MSEFSTVDAAVTVKIYLVIVTIHVKIGAIYNLDAACRRLNVLFCEKLWNFEFHLTTKALSPSIGL